MLQTHSHLGHRIPVTTITLSWIITEKKKKLKISRPRHFNKLKQTVCPAVPIPQLRAWVNKVLLVLCWHFTERCFPAISSATGIGCCAASPAAWLNPPVRQGAATALLCVCGDWPPRMWHPPPKDGADTGPAHHNLGTDSAVTSCS